MQRGFDRGGLTLYLWGFVLHAGDLLQPSLTKALHPVLHFLRLLKVFSLRLWDLVRTQGHAASDSKECSAASLDLLRTCHPEHRSIVHFKKSTPMSLLVPPEPAGWSSVASLVRTSLLSPWRVSARTPSPSCFFSAPAACLCWKFSSFSSSFLLSGRSAISQNKTQHLPLRTTHGTTCRNS